MQILLRTIVSSTFQKGGRMESITPSQNEAHTVKPFQNIRSTSKFKVNAHKPFLLGSVTSKLTFANSTSTCTLIFKY